MPPCLLEERGAQAGSHASGFFSQLPFFRTAPVRGPAARLVAAPPAGLEPRLIPTGQAQKRGEERHPPQKRLRLPGPPRELRGQVDLMHDLLRRPHRPGLLPQVFVHRPLLQRAKVAGDEQPARGPLLLIGKVRAT